MWVQYKAPKHQIEGPCLPQRRLLLVQRRVERRGPRACRCQALRHSPTDRTVHQPHPSQSDRAFANKSDQLQLSALDTAGGQHLTLYTPPPLHSHTTPLGDSNRLWNLCGNLILKEFFWTDLFCDEFSGDISRACPTRFQRSRASKVQMMTQTHSKSSVDY